MHCALTLDYANPQQHRTHDDLVARINEEGDEARAYDSHLLYFLLVVISFGVWLMMVVFVLVVRVCCARSIVKVLLLAFCLLCTDSWNAHTDVPHTQHVSHMSYAECDPPEDFAQGSCASVLVCMFGWQALMFFTHSSHAVL